MARKGVDAAMIGARLGATPADGPRATQSGGMTLVGVGPGAWLATAEDGPSGWAEGLRDRLAGVASVSDQSSGYKVFRFRGDGARELLQRGAFIDLHPAVFPPGTAATTVIAHIGVILWALDETPTFDVAVFRSFVGSFLDWIEAATSGLAVQSLPDRQGP
jgi:sarcosine oxidase subunit gamma